MTKQPGLRLKSGIFSDGKTVNSVRDSTGYNKYEQINIFNQPTGYTNLMIRTPNDLTSLLKDIYYYHLYYNSYSEKIEQLEIYKNALSNIQSGIKTLPYAKNIPYINSRLQRYKTYIGIFFGKIPICNLLEEHIKKEIHYIENIYLKERKTFTDKYGIDLILHYFNFISLDEAQIYFGARSWEKNFSGKNEFLKEFIAYPVKLNCRLEPIVQNPNMLDINFRRQASTYVLHTSHFFSLIQKTAIIDVKDTEKVSFENADVISKSYRLNLYKIFGYPKYQYYRTHLIKPSDPDIYRSGDYFKYVKKMTLEKNSISIQNNKSKTINDDENKQNNIQNSSQENKKLTSTYGI